MGAWAVTWSFDVFFVYQTKRSTNNGGAHLIILKTIQFKGDWMYYEFWMAKSLQKIEFSYIRFYILSAVITVLTGTQHQNIYALLENPIRSIQLRVFQLAREILTWKLLTYTM